MKYKKRTFDEFLTIARQLHGEKYLYIKESFSSFYKKIEIICLKHGLFLQRASDHCNGSGCKKCAFEKLKKWSSFEDDFLIENYRKIGIKECSAKLNKSFSSVSSRASSLNIVRRTHKDQELSFIPKFIIKNAKANAFRRGGKKSEYDIDNKFLENLFVEQKGLCALSGCEIVLSKKISENTASLDRINSNYGYINGNVQWVHKKINFVKNILSDSDLYKICKSISNHRLDLAEFEILWEDDIYNDTVVPIKKEKIFQV